MHCKKHPTLNTATLALTRRCYCKCRANPALIFPYRREKVSTACVDALKAKSTVHEA